MKVTRTSREPVQDEGTSTRSCRHSVEDGAAGPLLCTVMIRPLRRAFREDVLKDGDYPWPKWTPVAVVNTELARWR